MFKEDKFITSMANLLLHIGEFLEEQYEYLDDDNSKYSTSIEYGVMVDSLKDLQQYFQQGSGYSCIKKNNKDE
jgi:hypothetical protein